MSHPSDLEDSKLQTQFDRRLGVTIHRSDHADWASGRGKIVVEERWAFKKQVGEGAFGRVSLEARQGVKGSDDPSHLNLRAVKELRKVDMQRMKIDVHKELEALTKFSRSKFFQTQAFVNFLGWFDDEEKVYIAMEYFQYGTLGEYISESLSEKDARIITLQLLEGLKIMHDEHFTHRDLKPQNIFVVQHSPNWWVKIGDFGISKRVANEETALQSNVGTPLYRAPEVAYWVSLSDEESGAYTSTVDVWSLACVAYEMLALHTPFVDWPKSLIAFCNGGEFPAAPLARRASEMAVRFVQSVLVPYPGQRPSAKEALESPWFQGQDSHASWSPATGKLSEALDTHTAKDATMVTYSHEKIPTLPGQETMSDTTKTMQTFLKAVVWPPAIKESKGETVQLPVDKSSLSMEILERPKSSQSTLARKPPRLPLLPRRTETPSTADTGRPGTLRSIQDRAKDARTEFPSTSYTANEGFDRKVRQERLASPSTPSSHLNKFGGAFDKFLRKTITDNQRNACRSCHNKVTDYYHYCSVCDFRLCTSCVGAGKHCKYEDHWIVKRNLQKNDNTTDTSTTRTAKKWIRWSVGGTTNVQEQSPPVAYPGFIPTRWLKTNLDNDGPRDYCHQCRTGFSVSKPPRRHLWEQHDTIYRLSETLQAYSKTSIPLDPMREVWMKEPTEEDQQKHGQRMERLETELTAYISGEVLEKEKVMRSSEINLRTNHTELAQRLEIRRAGLEKRVGRMKAIQSTPPSSPPPPPLAPKRRNIFSLR